LFIGAMDQAVILGGEESPFTVDASYNSQVWDADSVTEDVYRDSCKYSYNRSSVAFCYVNSGGSFLRYYDGVALQEIPAVIEDYELSLTGNTVVYINRDEGIYDLYRYDTTTGQNQLVDHDIANYLDGLCVSPSGDAVTYRDESNVVHLFVGDVESKTEISGEPFAISDGGKLIYYGRQSKGISWYFVRAGEAKFALAGTSSETKSSHSSVLLFNQDLTQVLVAVDNELWFSKDGSKPVRTVSLPETGESESSWGFSCLSTPAQLIDKNSAFLVPTRNLADQLYRFSDAILLLDREMQIRYITDSTSVTGTEAFLSGDSVAYLQKSTEYDGFDVYYLTDFRSTEAGIKIPFEYAEKVIMTPNQSIYIENDIGQIHCITGMSAPVLIDSYAHLIGQYEVDGSTYIYYEKDSSVSGNEYYYDLYRVADGSEANPQKVASGFYFAYIDTTGIYTVRDSALNEGVREEIYYKEIQYSKNGRDFSLLCTTEFCA